MENRLPDALKARGIDIGLALMLTVLLSYGHFLWVRHYRFGLVLEIDEAGYMSQAMAYANALKFGGISAWLSALSFPTKFAPLSPIVTSILMAELGLDENVAFYTHILFYAGTVLVTFWWMRACSSRLAATTASMLVATLPIIVLYTRTYQYGLPTTFFFLLANFAYYKSERFSSLLWSFCVGVALGLMLLSRTMSIAFLPAFGLVWFVDSRKAFRQNLLGLCIAVVMFLLVAIPWYALNFKEIFGYLFSFGYGANSSEYGGSKSMLSIDYLKMRNRYFMDSLFPFHFVCLFMLFVIGVFQQIRACVGRRESTIPSLYVPSAVAIFCAAILLSSKNIGSGFDAPLYPVMALCAICALPMWITNCGLRQTALVVIVLGCLLVGYFESDTSVCTRGPNFIVRSLMGSSQKNLCDGSIGEYIRGIGYKPGEDKPYWSDISVRDQRRWRDVSAALADRLADVDKSRNAVIYVTRNRLVNVNTVMLESIKR